MSERIFVADGLRNTADASPDIPAVQASKRAVTAYLYHGWTFDGWGSAPSDSNLAGMTGFYFLRIDASNGPGFGAGPQCDRLRSGLHAALVVS